MIFGILKKGSVNISMNGKTFNVHENISSERIAYLPQHSFVPRNLKVRDLIPLYFLEEQKQDAIFYDTLISKITAKKVRDLSLGQVRYLEVLLVGNLNHDFLMLDEPFSMIEPLYKIEIKKLLNKLKFEKGIIITDHYYQDVLDISSQNLFIENGVSIPIKGKENLKRLHYLSKNSI